MLSVSRSGPEHLSKLRDTYIPTPGGDEPAQWLTRSRRRSTLGHEGKASRGRATVTDAPVGMKEVTARLSVSAGTVSDALSP